MTISAQAKAITEALNDWADAEGGKAFIAYDLRELWQVAQVGSTNPRVILCYNGEEVRGEFGIAPALGRVDRQWVAAFTRSRGFNAERGDSLSATTGNARPFYDLVEEGRDIIRALMLETNTTERPIDFRSVRPMQLGELIVDGFMVEFSIGTQLPQVLSEPENPVPDLPNV